jgi:hypothetical protein
MTEKPLVGATIVDGSFPSLEAVEQYCFIDYRYSCLTREVNA